MGNTQTNVMSMGKCWSKEVLKHCGGNASHHASDTRKESRDTCKELLSDHRLEHEIKPKSILICGLSRADNLTVSHTSIATFDNTEGSNHRQRDHRHQLLWSFHDLIQLDRLKDQGLMDKLLEGSFASLE